MGLRGVLGRLAAVATLSFALAAPGAALGAEDPPDPGTTTSGTYASGGTNYTYLSYVPTGLPAGQKVPLVVMIHGAQTTALQEVHATGFNRLAERDKFIVLYPDTDEIGSNAPAAINHSWKFYDVSTYFRGNGDSAAIAGMTQAIMKQLPVDPERVYAIGTSAGGLMQTVESAAYSDVFAAAGNVESAAFADGECFGSGTGQPVETSASLAFAQMGERARVVPLVVMTSDADQAFPASCGEKASQQALRTNNLVLSGTQTAPLSLTPSSVRSDAVPGGYTYDVSSYTDPAGCLVGEKWLIHGMPHTWPGGPTVDPRYTGYTDPKAPSGAEATWAFVRRFTKTSTAPPCTEAVASDAAPATVPTTTPTTAPTGPGSTTVAPAPLRCRRTVTVRLPKGARAVRVRTGGRRVAARRVSPRRLRIRRPARSGPVVVRGRTATGRRFVRRHRLAACPRG